MNLKLVFIIDYEKDFFRFFFAGCRGVHFDHDWIVAVPKEQAFAFAREQPDTWASEKILNTSTWVSEKFNRA